jgi:EAL domain-containing protein (putative c-di-GMP-specific phosphodiesterase class I)
MSGEEVHVLLVDDDPLILRALRRVLKEAGFIIESAADGAEALAMMRGASFDVVVTDVKMPNTTGIEFLRDVRALDLDVPIILMTGTPDVETAMAAVEYGAFRYLRKPIQSGELEATIRRAVLMHGLARLKRQALDVIGAEGMRLSDKAALESHFATALGKLWMAYQPIVSVVERRVFAYEALLRSDDPTLPNPCALLDAAERLGRLRDLGRAVRASVGNTIPKMPLGMLAFVNLHADDLLDDDLYDPASSLAKSAHRVVLEVTERASLDDVTDLVERMSRLRRMGYRIAVDDLGAGYAGLSSLARLEPEVIKLDMSLVRGIDGSPVKRQLVESMVQLAKQLKMKAVAEGVETFDELQTLVAIGVDLVQGYYLARPQRELVVPPLERLLPQPAQEDEGVPGEREDAPPPGDALLH